MMGIIFRIISSLASLVPTRDQICFSSFPDYSDNAYTVFQYLLREGYYRKYTLVWLCKEKKEIGRIQSELGKNEAGVKVLDKYTVKGVWAYIRSRYVFETHGLYPSLRLRQHPDKHICMWHGMPLKKVGAMIGEPCSPNCNLTLANSSVFQEKMAEAFALPLHRVWVTGQPRCDELFCKTTYWDSIGFDASRYKSVGIWMPTYRKSIVGDIRTDGTFMEQQVGPLSFDDLKQLDAALASMEAFLFIKIHPMDALQQAVFPSFTHIRIIFPQDFSFPLYPFLGSCDYLLTDYSSVFIDYDICQRPMAFIMDDIDAYSGSRGLCFDDLEAVLPGPVLTDLAGVIAFIRSPYRKESSIELNQFKDNQATLRLIQKLGIEK